MLTLLSINKILALYVGPTGYAALGQFQNAVQMISAFASGAVNTGVTKYTAEYQGDDARQRKVWQTAGTIALIGSIVLSITVFLLRERLALWFLNDAKLSLVFVWFGSTLVLLVFNTLLLAILNGKNDIRRYVLANIAGSIFALGLTTIMVMHSGLLGALISLAVYQSLAFFVTLMLCLKTTWFGWRELFGPIDPQIAKNLAKFTAMALTSAATVPLCHILIRDYLGQTLGWSAAGYWEAMWRLSSAYLMLITSTLSVYFLPKLSALFTINDIKLEIISAYKIIIPVVSILGFLIFASKDIIVQVLFSQDFNGMKILFLWQIIGDVVKICSWILAYILISKAMHVQYIISEIIFSISFYLLVVVFVNNYGLEGASIAHTVNYSIYFLFTLAVIFKFKSRIGHDAITE